MPLVVEASGGSRRTNYPTVSEGSHAATLTEVKDLGMVETRFGPKHRVRFTWRVDDATPPSDSGWAEYRLFQAFNLTLAPQSELRKALRQILSHDPGDRFDLETLVGRPATVIVQHHESGGRTFANIAAVVGQAVRHD